MMTFLSFWDSPPMPPNHFWSYFFLLKIGCHIAQAGFELLSLMSHVPHTGITGVCSHIWTMPAPYFAWLTELHLSSSLLRMISWGLSQYLIWDCSTVNYMVLQWPKWHWFLMKRKISKGIHYWLHSFSNEHLPYIHGLFCIQKGCKLL